MLLGKKIFRDCPTPDIECSECQWSNSCQEATIQAILSDCKSFYYVYCWLDQESKMPVNNGNQEQFDEKIDRYIKKLAAQPNLMIPKCTNGAFAVELAMKFLYAREHKSYDNIHNLKDLFQHLPEIHKDELLDRIKIQAHQTEETIEAQLPFFSDAFVRSRYFFEHGSFGLSGLFDPFVKIVCEYALEFDEPDEFEVIE